MSNKDLAQLETMLVNVSQLRDLHKIKETKFTKCNKIKSSQRQQSCSINILKSNCNLNYNTFKKIERNYNYINSIQLQLQVKDIYFEDNM